MTISCVGAAEDGKQLAVMFEDDTTNTNLILVCAQYWLVTCSTFPILEPRKNLGENRGTRGSVFIKKMCIIG